MSRNNRLDFSDETKKSWIVKRDKYFAESVSTEIVRGGDPVHISQILPRVMASIKQQCREPS